MCRRYDLRDMAYPSRSTYPQLPAVLEQQRTKQRILRGLLVVLAVAGQLRRQGLAGFHRTVSVGLQD